MVDADRHEVKRCGQIAARPQAKNPNAHAGKTAILVQAGKQGLGKSE